MLSENREYHFLGELNLKRSQHLKNDCDPKDDTVNWLFAKMLGAMYSFVYTIENKEAARFGSAFKIHMAFTAADIAKLMLKEADVYEVYRGPEPVGVVKILKVISTP